jgi:hypothetical protein
MTELTLAIVTHRPRLWPWMRRVLAAFVFDEDTSVEVLVVDGSGGRVAAIDAMRPDPSPVDRWLEMPAGTPCGVLRNFALQEANGRYMAWLDDDDWAAPWKYQALIDWARHDDLDWASYGFIPLFFVEPPRLSLLQARGPVNSASVFRTEKARTIAFTDKRRASDVGWWRRFQRIARGVWRAPHSTDRLHPADLHGLYTRHACNTGNRIELGGSGWGLGLLEELGLPEETRRDIETHLLRVLRTR